LACRDPQTSGKQLLAHDRRCPPHRSNAYEVVHDRYPRELFTLHA
jgi:hypothetical protein